MMLLKQNFGKYKMFWYPNAGILMAFGRKSGGGH